MISPLVIARFWSKVDIGRPEACWPWSAARRPNGYGAFRLNERTPLAHRVAYLIATGVEPGALHVLHRCDNPPCCNPDHLFLGTNADNMADKQAKGRGNQPKGERHAAAKLTDDDVREMRRLRADGLLYREIAERFRVVECVALKACKGQTWGHVR